MKDRYRVELSLNIWSDTDKGAVKVARDICDTQKEKLKQEKLDNQVTSIDCRYANGKWTKMIICYGSGKQETE